LPEVDFARNMVYFRKPGALHTMLVDALQAGNYSGKTTSETVGSINRFPSPDEGGIYQIFYKYPTVSSVIFFFNRSTTLRRTKTTIFLFCAIITLQIFIPIGSASAAEPKSVLILPFAINADKDLAYLKKGVADMLASRLAAIDQVRVIPAADSGLDLEKIPQAPDAQTAAALGAEARVDYVLSGSLTVFGNNVSTDAQFFDVHQKQAVLNFSETGKTQGEVISHIDLLATRIKEEVFGTKNAPARAPIPAQRSESSEKTESSVTGREHPEKLLDKAAGAEFAGSEETTSAGELPATLWKTQSFKTEIKGFALGDVDGDKNNETVFIDPKTIYIYRHLNHRFVKVTEIPADPQDNFLGVDVADINHNAIAEIFVTSLSDKNRLRSFVLEWNGTEFKTLAKDENWYFRVIKGFKGTPPLLLGQKGGFNKVFSGPVYVLQWNNGGYTAEEPQRLPDWATVYGLTFGDVLNDGRKLFVTLTKNDTLSILDQDGKEEWTGSDTYGGSNVYLLAPGEKIEAQKPGQLIDPTAFGGVYLQQRIFIADLDKDNQNEVIVVKNQDASRGLLRRYRKYTGGNFEALIWDNVGLRGKWKTRNFSGYISDYDVADFDNDGTDELVFAVVAQSGNAFSDAKSYLVSWSIKK
jgi:TolB-like protein